MGYDLVGPVGQAPASVRCPPKRELTTAILAGNAVEKIGDHQFHVALRRRQMPAHHYGVMTWSTVANRAASTFHHSVRKLHDQDRLQIGMLAGGSNTMGFETKRRYRVARHG